VLREEILDRHAERRADPRERVDRRSARGRATRHGVRASRRFLEFFSANKNIYHEPIAE
jgi:hypothetical protein